MSQQSLFPIEVVDPGEVESEDKRLARIDAYDQWNADYLRDFYMRRAAAILSSGDVTRIRLLHEWQSRERRQAA